MHPAPCLWGFLFGLPNQAMWVLCVFGDGSDIIIDVSTNAQIEPNEKLMGLNQNIQPLNRSH